ncbi:MAG: hypothetical protein ACOYS2_01230 [Patescibacteria group bacterium]
MSKLGFNTKGDFQAHYFGNLISDYFKGGNAQGPSKNVQVDIAGIIAGLSRAWDEAEEETEQ